MFVAEGELLSSDAVLAVVAVTALKDGRLTLPELSVAVPTPSVGWFNRLRANLKPPPTIFVVVSLALDSL
jgi:hypothetical protein